jgi:cell division septation protein DedD
VEFVGLPEEARSQIKDWIPLPLHPSGSAKETPLVETNEPAKDALPTGGSESAVVVPESNAMGRVDENQRRYSNSGEPVGVLHGKLAVSQDARHGISPAQETTSSPETSDRARTSGSSKSPERTLLFLTALLLLSGFFLLGPFFRRVAHGSQATEVIAGAKVAKFSDDISANPKTLSVDPGLSWDQPGFVLQVGAMAHEENADALAESLRQRNFPVIVSRSGTSRLYRVVVGPYNDVDSSLRVKEQLSKQGFDVLRTTWNPSAR